MRRQSSAAATAFKGYGAAFQEAVRRYVDVLQQAPRDVAESFMALTISAMAAQLEFHQRERAHHQHEARRLRQRLRWVQANTPGLLAGETVAPFPFLWGELTPEERRLFEQTIFDLVVMRRRCPRRMAKARVLPMVRRRPGKH
jgi:hypothetical protein